MNSLNKFLLIASVLLAVEAGHKTRSSNPEGCPVKFPDGFFCNLICQEWHMLKGNTVMCFISNNGEYHRLVGRNPAYGIWRFYKVDETSDVDSLCKVSSNGDKFFLNKTDVTCSNNNLSKRTHEDDPTTTTEHPEISDDEDYEPSSDNMRFSLKELISKINKEVAKLIHGKTQIETEPGQPASRSAYRSALARSASTKSTKTHDVPPMDDVCQLITTDVCRQHKIIACETDGPCCWAQTDSEACNSESLAEHNECHKGLGVLLSATVH